MNDLQSVWTRHIGQVGWTTLEEVIVLKNSGQRKAQIDGCISEVAMLWFRGLLSGILSLAALVKAEEACSSTSQYWLFPQLLFQPRVCCVQCNCPITKAWMCETAQTPRRSSATVATLRRRSTHTDGNKIQLYSARWNK